MLPRGQASREGEVCSILRHSVRFVAEGVAGPARICNAGAGFRDTKVAPRGRGGQGGRSRVTQPCLHCDRAPTRDAPTDAWGLTPLGDMVSGPRGRFLAWARIARLCLSFKRGGEIAGSGRIGGEKWCRRGEEVGRARDWVGQGWERVTQQSDVFSGTGERVGRVWARGCGRGVQLGRPGEIG